MNNEIAQFIDNYAGSDQIIGDDLDTYYDVEISDDVSDEPTSWEVFCREADAWARHAQASNGFGGF